MVIPPEKKVNYLRLSITDRCNQRCIYCMPVGKDCFVPSSEIMTFEEMVEAVDILSQNGIELVRITGGEPLVRPDAEVLVRMLRANSTLSEISMTTNGTLLRDKLPLLIQSGLDRLNVSLNTFKKDRYEWLAGVDGLEEVRASIREALSMRGLLLKINTVILKGMNDDEIEDFAAFTLTNRASVRFIEYFPTNNGKSGLRFVPNSLVRERIERRFGKLFPDETKGNGPAVNYRIHGAEGRIGFINTRTSNICQGCNRLRLTATGRLYPCLFSPFFIDLKKMLRDRVDKREIEEHVIDLIFKKRNYSKNNIKEYEISMSEMGG